MPPIRSLLLPSLRARVINATELGGPVVQRVRDLDQFAAKLRSEQLKDISASMTGATETSLLTSLGIDAPESPGPWFQAAMQRFNAPSLGLFALLQAEYLAAIQSAELQSPLAEVLRAIFCIRLGEEPQIVMDLLGASEHLQDLAETGLSVEELDLRVQHAALLIPACLQCREFAMAEAISRRLLGVDAAGTVEQSDLELGLTAGLRRATRGPASILAWRIAVLWGIVLSSDQELLLLETWFSMDETADRTLSRGDLRDRIGQVELGEACEIVLEWGEALGQSGKRVGALQLLQSWFAVEATQDPANANEPAEAERFVFDPGLVDGLPAQLRVRCYHEVGVALGFMERDAEKVEIMLELLGLDRAAIEGSIPRESLESVFSGVAPMTAGHYLREVSAGLRFVPGGASAGVELMCSWARLTLPLTRLSARTLRERLADAISQVSADALFTYAEELAAALGELDMDADRMHLLFSFPPEPAVALSNRCVWARSIAEALALEGRHDEAVGILEEVLELDGDSFDSGVIEVKVGALRAELGGNAFGNVLQQLVLALRDVGRHADSLKLALAVLGVDVDKLSDVGYVTGCVERALDGLYPGTSSVLVAAFGSALGLSGRTSLKAEVLLRWLQLGSVAGLAHVPKERARERLNDAFRDVPPNNRVTYMYELAGGLSQSARPDLAIRMLATFTGNVRDLWGRESTDPKAPVFIGVSQVSAAVLVQEIASALHALGRIEEELDVLLGWLGVAPDAADPVSNVQQSVVTPISGLTANNGVAFVRRVAQAWMALGERKLASNLLNLMAGPASQAIPETASLYFSERLRSVVGDGWDEYRTVAAASLTCLRQGFEREQIRRVDQVTFIERVAHLRRALVQAGFDSLPDATDPGLEDAAVELLCWDAELAQRGMFERLRLRGETAHPEADEVLNVSELPFHPAERAPTKGDALMDLDRMRVGLPDETAPPVESRDLTADPMTPVDPLSLGKLLEDDDVLLRASIGHSGRIGWLAFRRADDGLRLLARRASEDAEDGVYLQWRRILFELERQVWTRFPDGQPALSTAVEDTWRSAPSALSEDTSRLPLSLQLSESLNAASARARTEDFDEAVRTLAVPTGAWRAGFDRAWNTLVDALTTSIPYDVDGRLGALDRATERYLDDVARVVCLDNLLTHLGPESALVVAPDEALLAVPFSMLPAGKERICQRVASVRTWLSPLAEQESRIHEQVDADLNGVLTVSGMPAEDDSSEAIRNLHRAATQILESTECTRVLGSGEVPAGTFEALAAGMAAGPWSLVRIAGHGSEHGGISLNGQRWSGRGIDFSEAEFIILVSCSLGRLMQSRMTDASGFCANLMASGGRSLLAYQFPVRTVEAVAVANAVSATYVELRSRAARPAGLRARAVAQVQRQYLGHGQVRLDTLAAMGLFGLA